MVKNVIDVSFITKMMIMSLCLSIILLKTNAYVTGYDNETEYVHLLTEDGEVLQKYNKVWDKFSSSTKIKVDNEPLCSM